VNVEQLARTLFWELNAKRYISDAGICARPKITARAQGKKPARPTPIKGLHLRFSSEKRSERQKILFAVEELWLPLWKTMIKF